MIPNFRSQKKDDEEEAKDECSGLGNAIGLSKIMLMKYNTVSSSRILPDSLLLDAFKTRRNRSCPTSSGMLRLNRILAISKHEIIDFAIGYKNEYIRWHLERAQQ